MAIYTIGHSTRAWPDFVNVLSAHSISCLVDVRAFPASRRFPQFNRERMAEGLPRGGIEYRWMQSLGGRRGKQREGSPNLGLRNESFRNYADYMLSENFQQAAGELASLASQQRTAGMCAEKVFFQCHRMLLSDYLALHGHEVLHIVIYSAGPLFKDGVA